ncbi:MAG: HEPN domain-containing protein [Desulfuromonadaceae bacterium]|nr:HEPN domain-containing protein [Desulfuromonadaceae bacterium]MDD2734731.1 HEPN domain-containing protein [Desulfuromonadaceae bacterium]
MPPDASSLGTPLDWLNRAKSNLAIARQPRTDEIYWEDLCFETQQAAEKALKAVLLARGIKFRFVHDLSELLTALEQNGISLPPDVKEAAILTDYSVEARYPGPFEPVTQEEFLESLRIAEAVVAWAGEQV